MQKIDFESLEQQNTSLLQELESLKNQFVLEKANAEQVRESFERKLTAFKEFRNQQFGTQQQNFGRTIGERANKKREIEEQNQSAGRSRADNANIQEADPHRAPVFREPGSAIIRG